MNDTGSPPPRPLQGKAALVTGGASGIGFGIASRLAAAGAAVAIGSRRHDLCDQKAAELSAAFGTPSQGVTLNVRDSASVNAAFSEAARGMGKLDIVVNAAAGNFYCPAESLSDNQWRAIVETDLYGTFYCCRAAFPYLKDTLGVIINISMTLHHGGWPGMVPACAAKAGIDSLTQTLALEWARFGIRVNGIAPGPVATEGVKEAFKAGGDFEKWRSAVPLGRLGTPEEVGDLAVYMASPAAAWMTGTTVTLDGAEHLSHRRAGLDAEALDLLAEELAKRRTP